MPNLVLTQAMDDFLATSTDALARAELGVLAAGEMQESAETTNRNSANTDWGEHLFWSTAAAARTLTLVSGLEQHKAFSVELSDATNGLTIAAGASVTITGGNVTMTTTGSVVVVYHTGTLNTYRIFSREEYATLTGTETLTNKDLTSETNKIRYEKDVLIESPGAAENITLFKTNKAITISQINACLVTGTATPSVTLQLYHSTTADGTTNTLVASGAVTSTTGTNLTISDGTIPASSWVKVVTTAQSGTVPQLFFHFEGSED